MDSSDRDPTAGSDLRRAIYEAALGAMAAETQDARPPRDDFSLEEVLNEVALVLADTERHLNAGTAGEALLVAGDDAVARDRAKAVRGPRHLGSLFAGWLIKQADRATYGESVSAALAAARGSHKERDLARVLRQSVSGLLDGSMTFDDISARRPSSPWESRVGDRPGADRSATPTASVALAECSARLQQMMGQSGLDDIAADPLRAWRVFVVFASLPVVAEPPDKLDAQDGDLFLFEWGRANRDQDDAPQTHVAFARQLASYDASGERLEQVRCSFLLAAVATPAAGLLWSGPDLPLSDWVPSVEGTAGFSLLRDAQVVFGEIEHEAI